MHGHEINSDKIDLVRQQNNHVSQHCQLLEKNSEDLLIEFNDDNLGFRFEFQKTIFRKAFDYSHKQNI